MYIRNWNQSGRDIELDNKNNKNILHYDKHIYKYVIHKNFIFHLL